MRGILLPVSLTFCSLLSVNGIHHDCLLQLDIQREKLHCLTRLNKHNVTEHSEGCAGIWDNITCWMPAKVGETVSMPCSVVFRHFTTEAGNISKKCTAEGWTGTFPDYAEACGFHINKTTEEVEFFVLVKAIYTLGHSASLITLTTGSAILCFCRKLHCTRNYIHLNLFLSFILRAVFVLLKDKILYSGHGLEQCNEAALVGCRTIMAFFHYFIMANFYWLQVEGLYLHTLLMVFFSENKYFVFYMLIGWGMPTFFIIIWIIMRIYFEDYNCWNSNYHIISWWTVKGPILASITVTFVLFVSIVRILIQKLKSPDISGKDNSQCMRLAKSTLLLIPLLGINYIVLAFIPDEVNKKVKIVFDLCIGSFQVQVELKRKWRNLVSCCHLNSDYSLHRTSISGNGTAHRNTRAQSILQTETSLV